MLTISPVLMEKYPRRCRPHRLPRPCCADPLPKPLEIQYHNKDKKIRRVDFSTIEANGRIEFDGEYTVRFGLPGERAADAKPVTLAFWMDGKLLHSMPVETKPSAWHILQPVLSEEQRCACSSPKAITSSAPRQRRVRTDPERSLRQQEKQVPRIRWCSWDRSRRRTSGQPQEDSDLRSENGGAACIDKIVTNLAHHAWRRPVTAGVAARLLSSSRWRGREAAKHGLGNSARRSRPCWSRRIFRSASSTIRIRPTRIA